jgi:hypothetical protein
LSYCLSDGTGHKRIAGLVGVLHEDIYQHPVVMKLVIGRQYLRAVCSFINRIAEAADQPLNLSAHTFIVINDQEFHPDIFCRYYLRRAEYSQKRAVGK